MDISVKFDLWTMLKQGFRIPKQMLCCDNLRNWQCTLLLGKIVRYIDIALIYIIKFMQLYLCRLLLEISVLSNSENKIRVKGSNPTGCISRKHVYLLRIEIYELTEIFTYLTRCLDDVYKFQEITVFGINLKIKTISS